MREDADECRQPPERKHKAQQAEQKGKQTIEQAAKKYKQESEDEAE